MERTFTNVVNEIKKVAPQELVDKLTRKIPYWAPEAAWYNLTQLINNEVFPSSSDDTSVEIYAILCGCTKNEMRERFVTDGI